MLLTKRTQYGFLFCLYLARAGRATLHDASANLKLSKPFLGQIARQLRIKGLVVSTKGPGGGYTLVPNINVGDILWAFDDLEVVTNNDLTRYRRGEPEERALASFVMSSLTPEISLIFSKKVTDVMGDLVRDEMSQLDAPMEVEH